MRKVLIANRGEIAVRVVRACRDAGPRPASPSTPTPTGTPRTSGWPTRRTRWAARPPPRRTCASTSCIDVAARVRRGRGAPGYGFLSENADFAQAVHRRRADLDRADPAGDPRPRRQGDRPAHRRSAPARRWCPAPPTRSPAPDEVVAFAREHGLPVAIKAAFGGGGRGPQGGPHAWRRSRSCSSRRSARRWPRSAAASASSSATWTSPGTSRRRCWPTSTAT